MAHQRRPHSVVGLIRRNDRDAIFVELRDELSDEDLQRAFQGNTKVKNITISFLEPLLNAYPLFANRTIATRANLKKLQLSASGNPNFLESNVPEALFLQFWEAARSNRSIEEITLSSFRFVARSGLFTAICTNIPASSLVLYRCDMLDPSQLERGAQALAAAIENNNIRKLKIKSCPEALTALLLQYLSDNTGVATLALEGYFRENSIPTAMCQLLESTTTIQRFKLLRCPQLSADQFLPIAEGLTNSKGVTCFKIADTQLVDTAAIHFQSILQNKRNLERLTIKYVNFGTDNGRDDLRQDVHTSLATALAPAGSSLRHLQLRVRAVNDQRFDFQPLLLAVAASNLVSFSIGDLQSQQQVQSLINIIPTLRVQTLEMTATDDFFFAGVKEELIQAVTQSFNLLSVSGSIILGQDAVLRHFGRTIIRYPHPFPQPVHMLDQNDNQRLAFYLKRNSTLHRWAYKEPDPYPVRVENKLVPMAILMAAQAGRNMLYASLRSQVDYLATLAPSARTRPPSTEKPAREEEPTPKH